ncbi:MAG: hypothetical protein V3S64_12095, partial [bacterium]
MVRTPPPGTTALCIGHAFLIALHPRTTRNEFFRNFHHRFLAGGRAEGGGRKNHASDGYDPNKPESGSLECGRHYGKMTVQHIGSSQVSNE